MSEVFAVYDPGFAGVSENITVRSIVGRFLEHSRTFYFNNGGDERVYLSSADWMPRNLNERVELLFPLEDPRHIARVKALFELQLADNQKAYVMRADGTYRRADKRGAIVNCQHELYHQAKAVENVVRLPSSNVCSQCIVKRNKKNDEKGAAQIKDYGV